MEYGFYLNIYTPEIKSAIWFDGGGRRHGGKPFIQYSHRFSHVKHLLNKHYQSKWSVTNQIDELSGRRVRVSGECFVFCLLCIALGESQEKWWKICMARFGIDAICHGDKWDILTWDVPIPLCEVVWLAPEGWSPFIICCDFNEPTRQNGHLVNEYFNDEACKFGYNEARLHSSNAWIMIMNERTR